MTFYLGVMDRAADGLWGVWFPDLPGCYSAGSNMDDLFTNGIEAVRLWAEDAIGDEGRRPVAHDHATKTPASLREPSP